VTRGAKANIPARRRDGLSEAMEVISRDIEELTA